MPSMIGMGLPRVSELVVDADLTIPAAYKIITRTVQAFAGGVLALYGPSGSTTAQIADNYIRIVPTRYLEVDTIYDSSALNRVAFPDGIKTDTIDDNGGANISVLEDILLDSAKSLFSVYGNISVLSNKTGTGAVRFSSGIETNHIAEYTAAHGIVFDDTVLMTTLTTMLSQMFRTATVSDTLRKSLDTETYLANGGDGFVKISSDITIPVNYVGSGNDFRIKFDGYDTGSGGLPKMAVFVNGVQVGVAHSTGGAYVTYNDDINNLKAGDTIAIYCNPNGMVGGRFYLRNFRLYCDDTVSNVLGSYTWT